jgi:hypothetical protein
MKRSWQSLLLALAVALAGCAETMVQDVAICTRNKIWAKMAWQLEKPQYIFNGAKQPHIIDYGRGFRDGYKDAASGGGQRVPLFPPTRYWGTHYQSPTGREEIQAWFAGYERGAKLGTADGVGRWMEIPMSGGEEAALIERRKKREEKEKLPPGRPVTAPEPPAEELPPSTLEPPMHEPLPLPPNPPGKVTQLNGAANQQAANNPVNP